MQRLGCAEEGKLGKTQGRWVDESVADQGKKFKITQEAREATGGF